MSPLALVLAGGGMAADGAAPASSGSQAGVASAEAGGGDPGRAEAFAVPIAVGHEAKGVKVPWYGEAGALEMVFAIDAARRLDERRLAMERVWIETYDEVGRSSLVITLPNAVLDLATKVVTADDGPVVRRADFEISGPLLVFDTVRREGKFTGKTRMLIYNGIEPSAAESK